MRGSGTKQKELLKIPHVLTDNGLEFTNKLLKSKKGELYKVKGEFDKMYIKNKINQRLIKPFTPKTNGTRFTYKFLVYYNL